MSDKMDDALLDPTNENNFAPDDDIEERVEPVGKEATTYVAMFEELQSELWPAWVQESYSIQFYCEVDAFKGDVLSGKIARSTCFFRFFEAFTSTGNKVPKFVLWCQKTL